MTTVRTRSCQLFDSCGNTDRNQKVPRSFRSSRASISISMLARATAECRLTRTTSRILDAFTLTERVVGEDDVAFAREVGEELLITRPRLAIDRVAERPQDARTTSRAGGHIEIGGDIQPRAALECQLLDSISGPFDGADDACVERSAIERTSKHFPEFADDGLLSIEHALPCRDPVDDLFPSIMARAPGMP